VVLTQAVPEGHQDSLSTRQCLCLLC